MNRKKPGLFLLFVIVAMVACSPAQQPESEDNSPIDSGKLNTPTPLPTATEVRLTKVPTAAPSPTPTPIAFYKGRRDVRPYVSISSELDGNQVLFEALGESPSQSALTFHWWQDETNPEPLQLSAEEGAEITITIPEEIGEYFINVTAVDERNNSFTARRIITVDDGEIYINTTDHHAEWINHMTLYEINAFDWYQTPDRFVGMMNYLDELADLGITTIWLTPVFEGDGLGYWTKNYYKINWWLGTEENFKNFVDTAHAKGIKVVLDLVFNHTWDEHPFFQDVLEKKAESPYADWYQWRGAPGESAPIYYYDWSNLPNLNVDNPEVQEYLIRVAEYWVINYDIDGYRCDVATGVELDSDTFWLNLTRRLKNIKPEIFLLAEAPASGGRWDFNPSTEHDKSILFDDRFASVYDWDLRPFEDNSGLIGSLSGWRSIAQLNAILTDEYPSRALPLRFIENHDLQRAPKLLDLERSKLGHAIIFTVPGVPLIYGGAEHGQSENSGNEGLLIDDPNNTEAYFARLINARKNYIDNDSLIEILPNNINTKVNSYATISDASIAISILNFSDQPQEITVDLTSIQDQLSFLGRFIDVFEIGKSTVSDDFSILTAALAPFEASILIYTSDEAFKSTEEIESKNILFNGDFSNGFIGWYSYIHDGTAEAEFVADSGNLAVNIDQGGTDFWNIQLIQSDIELVFGEKYFVEFTASADQSRSINVALQQDGGSFSTYGSQSFTISTEPKTYKFEFTMSADTDKAARFVMELGTSDVNIILDDIVLVEE